ncbi:MAG: serine hydrolase domain-containing protein [Allomuricauda sp.]
MKTKLSNIVLPLLLALISASTQQLYPQQGMATVEAEVDAYLDPLLAMDAWSGVIGIYKKGDPILTKGYGFADREWEIDLSTNGKFRLASISKVFTEVAILKLAEQGKISLNDKISSYLPEYPAGQKITVAQLMNHTSGIPHLNSFPNYNDLIKYDYGIEDIIALFKDKELDFEPGAKYSYSNSGYVLLASIIEKRSGQAYNEYLKTAIFEPLGMKGTGVDDEREVLRNRVRGYMFDSEAELVHADYVNMDIKIGGGSLYSTVEDLNTFTQSLVNHTLLNKESLALLPNIQGQGKEKIFIANGRVQGFCHQLVHKYDEGITIIVLGNHYSNIALPISDAIDSILKGESVELPVNYFDQAIKLSENELAAYLGVYDFGFGPVGEVEIKDGKLVYGNPDKKQRDVLVPIGNDRFFYPQNWVVLAFENRENNAFRLLNWVMGENIYPAKKINENEK